MKIGIDIDDTITNSWECLIPYYSKLFNIEEEVLRNSKPYYSAVSHLITLDEHYKIMLPVYDEVTPNVDLKPGVKEVIDKLYEMGCHITFITARGIDHTDAYKDSKDYLDKHNIRYDKIITNAKDKAIVCKEQEIDVFIDDSIRNCEEVSNAGIETLLYETNYNSDYVGLKHAKDWNYIYEYLRERCNSG